MLRSRPRALAEVPVVAGLAGVDPVVLPVADAVARAGTRKVAAGASADLVEVAVVAAVAEIASSIRNS